MRTLHILIVATDPQLSFALAQRLTAAHCAVQTAHDSTSAVQVLAGFPADIVLLDHHLRGADALEVCRTIRRQLPTHAIPLMILLPESQRDELTRRRTVNQDPEKGSAMPRLIRLFGRLVEPVHAASEPAPERLVVRGLTIDRKQHRADVDGRDLNLTLTEFRIIWSLSMTPGIVVSRKELADRCCGHGASIQQRTIDVHIRAIRHKLGNRADLIETVRGVGYRFADKPYAAVQRSQAQVARASHERLT